MLEQEWLTRCAARYAARAGLNEGEAMDAAKATRGADADGDFSEDPEGAADEDMDCWEGD